VQEVGKPSSEGGVVIDFPRGLGESSRPTSVRRYGCPRCQRMIYTLCDFQRTDRGQVGRGTYKRRSVSGLEYLVRAICVRSASHPASVRTHPRTKALALTFGIEILDLAVVSPRSTLTQGRPASIDVDRMRKPKGEEIAKSTGRRCIGR
jgi:hypothetical protein